MQINRYDTTGSAGKSWLAATGVTMSNPEKKLTFIK